MSLSSYTPHSFYLLIRLPPKLWFHIMTCYFSLLYLPPSSNFFRHTCLYLPPTSFIHQASAFLSMLSLLCSQVYIIASHKKNEYRITFYHISHILLCYWVLNFRQAYMRFQYICADDRFVTNIRIHREQEIKRKRTIEKVFIGDIQISKIQGRGGTSSVTHCEIWVLVHYVDELMQILRAHLTHK